MTGRLTNAVKFLLLSLLIFSSLGELSAQQKQPVRMRLQPLSTRGRSGGAIPLRIKLEYNSPQILEGDLRLQVYNSVVSSDDLAAELCYEGIVLQGSDYIFDIVLPPIEHSYNKLFQIVAWFETEDGKIPLTADPKQVDPPAPHDLLSLSRFERSTLICSCAGTSDARKPSATRAFLGQRLALDNYNPEDRNADASQPNEQGLMPVRSPNGVQSFTASWSVVDFPEDPLKLCCFDVVLLADGAMGLLEPKQMEALAVWIRAGGSLCVLPDSKRLRGPHLEFLQNLFEDSDDPSVKLTLSDSELLVISDVTSPIINRFFGLGRVTLLPNIPDLTSRLTDDHLARINAHLWKIRTDNPILQGGGWYKEYELQSLLAENNYNVSKNQNGFLVQGGPGGHDSIEVESLEDAVAALNLTFKLEPQANPLNSAAETALLPKGIRMVPTWVIALLLIAYVIAIGPLDYLVLGFFKARKYTWLAFPVVTAIFTWLTVSIAHSYLSSTDSGGRVTIIDVGDAGDVIRQTELQMHFYAAQTQVEHEMSQQFIVPAQVAAIADWQRYQNSAPRPVNTGMSYSGRFPQSYSTVQSVRQWEPQTVRTLTLAPEGVDLPPCDWTDNDLLTTAEGRQQLAQQLKIMKFENEDDARIDAVVIRKGELLSVLNGFLFSDAVQQRSERWTQRGYWQRQYDEPDHDAILSQGVISAASCYSNRSFFSIVSQVSPHGAATMEDVPILDSTNPNEWLLMVAVNRGGNTTIYRKLFRNKRPALIGVE